jgi:hypothetical protein
MTRTGGPDVGARLRIEVQPQTKVRFFGSVPGYSYLNQASNDLPDWQALQLAPIAHVGDVSFFFEPSTNTQPHRSYKLNLAPEARHVRIKRPPSEGFLDS